jgi:hypothetical protein
MLLTGGSFNNGSMVGPFIWNVNNGNANANNGFRLANKHLSARRQRAQAPLPSASFTWERCPFQIRKNMIQMPRCQITRLGIQSKEMMQNRLLR